MTKEGFVETETHSPAMISSYGNGLGTPINYRALNKVLQSFKPEDRGPLLVQLGFSVGQDDEFRVIKAHLVYRIKQLFGFSGDSDKNHQFEQLNDLARICILLAKKGYPPNGSLVDAVLIAVFGLPVQEFLTRKIRAIKCPKCNRKVSFVMTSTKDFLCLQCGSQLKAEQVRVTERNAQHVNPDLVEKIKGELVGLKSIPRGRVISVQLVRMDKILSGIQHREINWEKVEDLRLSIRKHGLLEPIRVRRLFGSQLGFFQIVFGNHRFEACKKEGYETINAEITEDDDEKASILNIVENLQRNEEKNYCLLGVWFKQLLTQPNWTLDRISKEIGKSSSYVESCIKYADLIDPRLHAVFSTLIPRVDIYQFSKLDREKQFVAVEEIKKLKEKKGKLGSWDVLKIIEKLRFPKEVRERKRQWKEEEEIGRCVLCKLWIMRKDRTKVKSRLRDGRTEEYVHIDSKDCDYRYEFVVSFSGEISSKKIRAIIDNWKVQLANEGVHITETGR